MTDIDFTAIDTETISFPLFDEKKIQADVLRLDKMHPDICGNKWFKLRYYLAEARQLGKANIVTFGGAWSNHLLATAAACRADGFFCTGIIRGERPMAFSPVLKKIEALGMQLVFISRGDYRSGEPPGIINLETSYVIPEGGYGELGARGAASIADYIQEHHYGFICCAAGTGTTAAGLGRNSAVIAISVLRNNNSLDGEIRKLDGEGVNILHNYHFGGYAKYTGELIEFMNAFFRATAIPSDFVYTGKLFFAIHDLVKKDHFDPGTKLLLIHSGGLIGNRSLSKGTLIF